MTTTNGNKTKKKSFFQKDVRNRYMLDEEFYIEHKPLNEGLFQAYQDLTSKVKLSGDSTEVDMRLGEQRKFLFENLTTGWNLVDEEGESIGYSFPKLLELPPHILTGLFDHINECNQILSGESDPKESKT